MLRYVTIKIKETKKLKDCRDLEIEFFGKGWDDLMEPYWEVDILIVKRYKIRKHGFNFL